MHPEKKDAKFVVGIILKKRERVIFRFFFWGGGAETDHLYKETKYVEHNIPPGHIY